MALNFYRLVQAPDSFSITSSHLTHSAVEKVLLMFILALFVVVVKYRRV